MNVANRDEASKCLEVAEAALGRGDHAKAERFALKAQKLFPTDQVGGRRSHFCDGGAACIASLLA